MGKCKFFVEILQPRFGSVGIGNKNSKNRISLHLLQLEELNVDNFPQENFGNDLALGVQKHQQLLNILESDLAECEKKYKSLEEVYDNVIIVCMINTNF